MVKLSGRTKAKSSWKVTNCTISTKKTENLEAECTPKQGKQGSLVSNQTEGMEIREEINTRKKNPVAAVIATPSCHKNQSDPKFQKPRLWNH